jgi:hypothetical protein
MMPKFAADIDGVRWYRHPEKFGGGYVYRSVTQTTGALPKPQLMRWYANVVAQMAVEQHEAWVNMPANEALDWLKGAPYRNRNRAAARGTTIHAVIEKLLKGQDYDIEAEVEPWIGAARKFIQDARPKPERLEASVYNDKVLTAGTLDFLGRLESAPELGRVLIDWKTAKGVYPDNAVQVVGGYALGSEYILTDEGKEIEWRQPDSALIVHFTPDGYTIRPIEMDKIYRRAFLGCLEIRKWETEGPKIGAPYQLHLEADGPAWDDMPTNDEVQHVRDRLRSLTSEEQLMLSGQCQELEISTKLKTITKGDLERLRALIDIYQMGVVAEDDTPRQAERAATWRRVMRPMP